MTAPIRRLCDPLRTLEQACAELGLDPADYRAARGEACETCGGSGEIEDIDWTPPISSGVPLRTTKPCPDCTGRQPERSAPCP